MNSVAKKFFVDDMNVAYGEADWFINAGCKGDKIYIHYGNEEVSYVVPYEYDSSTKVMSYSYSSVEPSDPQFAAALMSHYLFLFLVEADPNFATEAKAIMQDTNKLALVDVADVFDDGTSDWSLSMSGSNTVFNFAMLLIDNKATAFVNSYNSHVASGELPDSSFVSVPEAPVDPDPLPANPPAEEDPTQPTQPTQPTTTQPTQPTQSTQPTQATTQPTNASGVLGDCNGDGFVNSFDIMLIKRALLDTEYKSSLMSKADMNGDAQLNSFDIMLVKKVILEFK